MRSPHCAKGKVALASAPSASSATLLGTCRGGREQVDSCRRNRDMPDLRAVVLSRHRIHYR